MAEANHMEFIVPTAGPMVPPETDAQPLEPSTSAAKGRGRARKNAKQAVPTLSTCTFSFLHGASRHGLSATPATPSLHSAHCNVPVYVYLMYCSFGPYSFMLAIAAVKHTCYL